MATAKKVSKKPKAVPVTVPKWNAKYEALTHHLYDKAIQIHSDPDNDPPGVQIWHEIPGVDVHIKRASEKDHFDDTAFGQLVLSIEAGVVTQPILIAEKGDILDGYSVYAAFCLLDRAADCPFTIVGDFKGYGYAETFIRSKQMARRHLSRDEKVEMLCAEVDFNFRLSKGKARSAGILARLMAMSATTVANKMGDWVMEHITNPTEFVHEKLRGEDGKPRELPETVTEALKAVAEGKGGSTIPAEEGDAGTAKKNKKNTAVTKEELQKEIDRQKALRKAAQEHEEGGGEGDGWALYATDKAGKMTRTWFQTLDDAKKAAKDMCHHTLKWVWEDDEERWENTDKTAKIGGWGFTIYRDHEENDEWGAMPGQKPDGPKPTTPTIYAHLHDVVVWLEALDIRHIPDDTFAELVKLVAVVEGIAPIIHRAEKVAA